MQRKPTTIDEYLATVGPEERATLEKLRRAIRSIIPKSQECISYSMPAFRLNGHVVAGFLATKQGCSYYPFSGSTLGTLTVALAGYECTKSALHFDAKRSLPKALVRLLLTTRIAETKLQDVKKASKKARKKA